MLNSHHVQYPPSQMNANQPHHNNPHNNFPAFPAFPTVGGGPMWPSYRCGVYGQEELVWSGPLGVPFAGPPSGPVPYPPLQRPVIGQGRQWFSEMLQTNGMPPYPSQQPRQHSPFESKAKRSSQAKTVQQHPLHFGQELVFNGRNFPFRFLGPQRRESCYSNMPNVKYCESNRGIKLRGTPVRLADPKDVRDLFNSQSQVILPPVECSTWCFRGVHIRLCETTADIKVGVAELTSFHPEVVGLDCEWYHEKPGTLALIQISSARHCLLVRVCKLGGSKFPQEFYDFLSNPKIVKVGAGVKDDALKIGRMLGISVPSTIDLNWLVERAPMVSSGNFRRGLKKQAMSFLHTKMIGEYGRYSEFVDHTNIACSDWEADRLSMLQILYAADDAIFSYFVFMKLYLSYDRRRPCPNFDDSVYNAEPTATDILERLRDLVDRPSWLPRHIRERQRAESLNATSRRVSEGVSRVHTRENVHQELVEKFGDIIKSITACAPLDNLAQCALLKMIDLYDSPTNHK